MSGQVTELGEIDAPLLFYGGPYSNLQATEALVAAAEALGIPPERRINTGDIVAYCGDPQATAERVIAAGGHVVRGNCEDSFGTGAGDCGCGFAEGSACDLLARGWFRHAEGELDERARRFMAACPDQIRFTMGGRRVAVIHGGFSAVNRFVFPSDSEAMRAELTLTDADIVVAGHSGIPFVHRQGRRWWLNAGVVGMPANDGDPRTVFMTLAPAGDGIAARFHRLAYDHRRAAARMRAAGLAEAYAAALETGLWPNMDVMPAADRAMRGRPLHLPFRHIVSSRAAAA